MKGFRTVIVGLAMAVVPTALQYLAGLDWTQYVPAQYVPIVAGVVMIAMRAFTSTSIGSKS